MNNGLWFRCCRLGGVDWDSCYLVDDLERQLALFLLQKARQIGLVSLEERMVGIEHFQIGGLRRRIIERRWHHFHDPLLHPDRLKTINKDKYKNATEQW